MKSTPAAARVMVATDNVDDAKQILRQLGADFEHTRASTDPDLAVQDFEAYAPSVLVLAFDSLDKAQRYYLGLYRLGQALHQHPHRTVILCGKDEVRAVFDLCKKQYFDDYVLYWPHTHDGPRLAMSIWNACREMTALHANPPSAAVMLSHARHLGDLEKTLEHEFAESERLVAAGRHSHLEAEREIAGAIDAFSQRLQQRIAPSLAGTRALAERARGMRPVVMVVEDDELSRQLVARALDPKAWETVLVGDGAEAFGQLRRMRPDVILMDIRLPGLDGVSLTQRLKAWPELADIPIVMMTGDARKETLVSSMEAGAAAFVVKPFSRESLTDKLEWVLRR